MNARAHKNLELRFYAKIFRFDLHVERAVLHAVSSFRKKDRSGFGVHRHVRGPHERGFIDEFLLLVSMANILGVQGACGCDFGVHGRVFGFRG